MEARPDVIEELDSIVDKIGDLNSKLVLLVGDPKSGRSHLLFELSKRRQASLVNVGAALGRSVLTVPISHRHRRAAELLKNQADGVAKDGLLLLYNIELLFDKTMRLNPIDFLRRFAQVRKVVAVWPGDLSNDRLTYACVGHPEHRDYAVTGVVPFHVN